MSARWRWGFGAGVIIIIGVVAACSSSDDKAKGPTITEVARKQIGSQGGTLTGGGATVDVPEGAVDDGTTIIINTLDNVAASFPKSSILAGQIYSLQPDNVEFKKPVTVHLAIDPTKATGGGGIVIFRAPAGTNEWTVKGAASHTATEVTAQTTHFSWWAPGTSSDTSCLENRCVSDAAGSTDPTVLPGLNCVLPSTFGVADQGPAVHCKGTAVNDGPPYECGCYGTDAVLATFNTLPDDNTIGALAIQCGAACPPIFRAPCSLSVECGPYSGAAPADKGNGTPGWSCKTTSAPQLMTCQQIPGSSAATCTCLDGTVVPLPNISRPLEEDLDKIWADMCHGDCNPTITGSSSGAVGPVDSGGPDPNICRPMPVQNGNGCVIGATCNGNHAYSVTCTNDPGAGPYLAACTCTTDGAPSGTTRGGCALGGDGDPWVGCNFPAIMGSNGTNNSADAGIGVDAGGLDAGPGPINAGPCATPTLTMNGDGSCSIVNQPCQSHAYYEQCSPSGQCACIIDGVVQPNQPTSSCAATATQNWTLCGFPQPTP